MKARLFIILFLGINILRAQDTLFFKSGEIVPVKIIELSSQKVKYKAWNNQDGPLYIEARETVKEIHYANGLRNTDHGKGDANYYLPFVHTEPSTVSKLGVYGFLGLGGGSCENHGGIATFQSLSVAYKSHLFSVSRSRIFEIAAEYGGRDPYFESSYVGALIGESIRLRHGMLSLSTGIANSELTAYTHLTEDFSYNGVSIPLELKLCGLVYNGVGAGVAVTGNILPGKKYSQLMVTATLVFGKWNVKYSDQ